MALAQPSIAPSVGDLQRSRYLRLAAPSFRRNRQGSVRLLTLILLRWMAVLGQTIALVITSYAMDFSLPLWQTLGVVGVSAALNIALSVRYRAQKWLSVRGAFLNLAFDTVQLGVLLYFTGGIANPFALLFLVPVTVSATILPFPSTASLYGISVACITALALWYQPLPWVAGEVLQLPEVFKLGIWVALAFGMAFLSGYVSMVVREARSMGRALQATQMALERERRVSELGALAAAATHELGTPLNTIRVLVEELEEEFIQSDAALEDLSLIRQELSRCKRILDGIAREHHNTQPTHLRHVSPVILLEEIAALHRSQEKEIAVRNAGGPDLETVPTLERSPEIVHAMTVLVENAADFAQKNVTLTAHWTQSLLILDVEDDGPGIHEDLIESLGEPYVSGRASARVGSKHTGMGLGIFIARTLLERTDGALSFSNCATGGARARVVWHLDDLARSAAEDAVYV